MKVSLQWLSEYVALPPLAELVEKLTMAGLEVEGVHRPGAALSGVVVAQILESSPHPNADKLSVTRVDAGEGQPLQVVCGAKNYRVGDKVPLAREGTTLPGGTQISRASLRGVESRGMLCSRKELAIEGESSGLFILDAALKVGTPIAQALGLDDTVLELNVTPNRPDALSHLGIAREISALTGAPVKRPKVSIPAGGVDKAAFVRIDEPERCPRYACRRIDNVRMGSSPDWLRRRLEACGVRSINAVVDVTNYVLLEVGQPLHAFDFDDVRGGQIVVRRAKDKEKLRTLDGQERQLHEDDLAICDAERPLALAGVMGGESSEVKEKTQRILLECATFQPSGIRRTAKRHGLHTEASHRFERGTDIDGVPWALDRAAALIAELSGGQVQKEAGDAYPRPQARRTVKLRAGRAEKLLGMPMPEPRIREILEALGFTRGEGGGKDASVWQVPSERVDVEREEDLIEEVARIHGYGHIPASLPQGQSDVPLPAPLHVAQARVQAALSGAGFNEVVNYSFVAPEAHAWAATGPLSEMGKPRRLIHVDNPLSAEQSVMRQTLFTGLLQNLSHNLRHRVESVRLYEIGRGYFPDADGAQGRRPPAREPLLLSFVLWGKREGRTWASPDVPVDFFDAKGAVQVLLSALSIEGAVFEKESARAPFHPGACARVLLGGQELGVVGQIHPSAAKALDVPPATFLGELDGQRLFSSAQLVPEYRAISRFPAVFRDIALVVDAGMQSDEVRKIVLEVGGELLEDARIFDVYVGKPLPEGKKNLAYALTYRAKDRTLTDEEVSQAHGRIGTEVNARLGGNVRS